MIPDQAHPLPDAAPPCGRDHNEPGAASWHPLAETRDDPGELYSQGTLALHAGKFREAAGLLRRASNRCSDSPVILNALGVATENVGDLAAAAMLVREAAMRKPDYGEPWHNLGN